MVQNMAMREGTVTLKEDLSPDEENKKEAPDSELPPWWPQQGVILLNYLIRKVCGEVTELDIHRSTHSRRREGRHRLHPPDNKNQILFIACFLL